MRWWRRVTERSAELAKLKALTAEEHVSRSLQVGEQLHVLLQQALAALEAQDVRQLKTAVDCWSTWDKQMRANHRIEDAEAQKPLIDIQRDGGVAQYGGDGAASGGAGGD